mgnify:CR=1 FL=1
MTDLTKLTLAEARDKLKAKEITSSELTGAYIKEMEGARALNYNHFKIPLMANLVKRAVRG